VTPAWTAAQAERHLLSLELFGMRFGLDRMRRLMTALGSPQESFASIHVVGTNGKTSTVRMTAGILQAHGIRTGAYLSPHLVSFAERIRIDGDDLDPDAFGAAVQRAAGAAAKVGRTLADGDRVTQFEVLTAAAFAELARAGVEAAVIEAGLGGRYDASNVLPSRVQVLTNVGLEHTRWLGPTVRDIAREKLAVVQDGATLVVGAGLHPDASAEAAAAAERHGARLVVAPAGWDGELAAGGAYQRRNFALARAAAEAFLGALDEGAVREAARAVSVPGRFEIAGHDPLTIVDGAHNPDGIAATVASLPDRGPLAAVVSILDDKDAAAMLEAVLARCDILIATSNPTPRALSPATLESLARQLAGAGGRVRIESEPDPRAAVRRARSLAGRGGVVVATGSIYLVAELRREPGDRQVSML
jgi:dihydrofolate synthase / folylpolyglutamate synthase